MIPSQLQPLVNHLWQSTLFALFAGLLTLTLKRNRAQTRYCLWLAASVKFFLPFSILAMVGGYFGRPATMATTASAPCRVPLVVAQINEPFLASASSGNTSPAQSWSSASRLLPVLGAVWAIGFVAIVSSSWLRWRRLRAAIRAASPLHLPIGVRAISSPAVIEPGVFGIRRPILLVPDGILRHLTPAQLEAVLEHELCHIRRRDNLAAAVHMMVEAVFWFHPLVWWLGARLMAERKNACDEEVLRLGSEPEVYADGILKICELYLESPLPCVAGQSWPTESRSD